VNATLFVDLKMRPVHRKRAPMSSVCNKSRTVIGCGAAPKALVARMQAVAATTTSAIARTRYVTREQGLAHAAAPSRAPYHRLRINTDSMRPSGLAFAGS